MLGQSQALAEDRLVTDSMEVVAGHEAPALLSALVQRASTPAVVEVGEGRKGCILAKSMQRAWVERSSDDRRVT